MSFSLHALHFLWLISLCGLIWEPTASSTARSVVFESVISLVVASVLHIRGHLLCAKRGCAWHLEMSNNCFGATKCVVVLLSKQFGLCCLNPCDQPNRFECGSLSSPTPVCFFIGILISFFLSPTGRRGCGSIGSGTNRLANTGFFSSIILISFFLIPIG